MFPKPAALALRSDFRIAYSAGQSGVSHRLGQRGRGFVAHGGVQNVNENDHFVDAQKKSGKESTNIS